ncbi:type II toxin-antitoxin system VapC family toxin [uncultured Sphingomonas sp.]|uniref:type II toxin-antitoxin system VapC family toxin n=1 Tax=uncultured Sphingomonas sp. TaxID=158754 RepID=UPI0035CC96DA
MSAGFFDTDIVIDWLRRYPQAAEEIARYDTHRISRVTWSEVLAGEPSQARERIRRMIGHFDVVELDEEIATIAADIRHATRMKLLDALILATARVRGALLITRNTKAFPPEMPGIRIPYTL